MSFSTLLHVVGVGPGDPELITVKAARLLQTADVVFAPMSQSGCESLAHRVVAPHLKDGKRRVIELPLAMKRNAEDQETLWRNAARRIADALDCVAETNQTGRASGVYALLGDPMMYGSFAYVWDALRHYYPNIVIDITPGVMSFAAAAARTQRILGLTNERIAILPAGYETNAAKLRQLLSDYETVVFLKAGPVLPNIIAALEELDSLDAAVFAERVGMPEERIVENLETLRGTKADYFSLVIVKKTKHEASI